MQARKRIEAAVLCFVFILVTLFSVLFIITEAEHDCTGENCAICSFIQHAQQTLKQTGTGNSGSAILCAVIFFIFLVLSGAFFFAPCTSLIKQKVRLDN